MCIRDSNNLDLDVLIKKIYYLINNFEIRKKLNKNSKNIIDKKGSYRILEDVYKRQMLFMQLL